jgi:glycosyltransferase involved in cell wall biosynthesis
VITLQDGDPFEHVFDRWYIRPVKPLLLYGFRHATVVQTISSFLAEWAKRAGYRGTVEIIPNGVDTAHFSKKLPAAILDAKVKELGKKFGDIFVITTSRLIYKNAVDDMITALTLVPANVHFIILGTGPDEAKLRAQAQGLGIAGRIRFVGFVPHTDMPAYMQVSDIFIRASRSEGMGASFVEAMSAGLSVVATQEGGIADFLFDAKRNPGVSTTGWAVDRDSPRQIAETIKDIIAHPHTVREITERAQRLMVERYDWDLIVEQMCDRVFERVTVLGG